MKIKEYMTFEKLKCWTNEKMVLKQEKGNHKFIRNESFSSSKIAQARNYDTETINYSEYHLFQSISQYIIKG